MEIRDMALIRRFMIRCFIDPQANQAPQAIKKVSMDILTSLSVPGFSNPSAAL
jgi:hypothetical protein